MGFSVEALLWCAPSLFTDCVGTNYDTRYPLILTPPSLNSSHPFPALILLHLLCRDDASSDEGRSDWSMKAQMKEPSGSGGTHPPTPSPPGLFWSTGSDQICHMLGLSWSFRSWRMVLSGFCFFPLCSENVVSPVGAVPSAWVLE